MKLRIKDWSMKFFNNSTFLFSGIEWNCDLSEIVMGCSEKSSVSGRAFKDLIPHPLIWKAYPASNP